MVSGDVKVCLDAKKRQKPPQKKQTQLLFVCLSCQLTHRSVPQFMSAAKDSTKQTFQV